MGNPSQQLLSSQRGIIKTKHNKERKKKKKEKNEDVKMK